MNTTDIKYKIKSLIILIGITYNEIVIDVRIGNYHFDTIEWDKDVDDVFLHTFDENLSIEFTFDHLEEDVKEGIYNHLMKLAIL